MKKIHPVRIPVYIQTEIISGRKSFTGVIGNLSEKGAFVETIPTETAAPFLPGKKVGLKFNVSSMNTIKLNCEIIWLYTKNTLSEGLSNSMGMKIIAPPPEYKKYFKTL